MRMIALVKRILIQTIRDKRTLALMMLAPLILLSLVNFLFTSNNTQTLKVGVYNNYESFNEELETNDIEIIKYNFNENIKDTIKNDSLKAFINKDNDKLSITYENSTPSESTQIKAKVQASLIKEQMTGLTDKILQINKNFPKDQTNLSIESNYVYGNENLSFFDTLSPILIGFFVFFFVFLISGISLLKERTSKTLEKLLSTPYKMLFYRHLEFKCLVPLGIYYFLFSRQVIIFLLNASIFSSNILGFFAFLSFVTIFTINLSKPF